MFVVKPRAVLASSDAVSVSTRGSPVSLERSDSTRLVKTRHFLFLIQQSVEVPLESVQSSERLHASDMLTVGRVSPQRRLGDALRDA